MQHRGNQPPLRRSGGSLVLFLVGMAAAALLAAAAALRRVVVVGRSMAPTLLPGDRLLVVRVPSWWPLRAGSLVAVPDPRHPDRLLVKRASPAGAGALRLSGDNPDESTDSRTFGAVPRRSVRGVACYRYGPPERAGGLVRAAWRAGHSPAGGSGQVNALERLVGDGTL